MLVIVGTRDNPVYQLEFGTSRSGGDGQAKFREDARPMNQFIIHSSLDIVEELQFETNSLYLQTVDKFNSMNISTFLTAANVKFMLLHDVKNDDGIKNFFNDLYELYVKNVMNPFYRFNGTIRSKTFDNKVRTLARKYL